MRLSQHQHLVPENSWSLQNFFLDFFLRFFVVKWIYFEEYYIILLPNRLTDRYIFSLLIDSFRITCFSYFPMSVAWNVQNGQLDAVKQSVDEKNVHEIYNGRTAVQIAADYGQTAVIAYLISIGANIQVDRTDHVHQIFILFRKRTNTESHHCSRPSGKDMWALSSSFWKT